MMTTKPSVVIARVATFMIRIGPAAPLTKRASPM
jgi:hypothetical protein